MIQIENEEKQRFLNFVSTYKFIDNDGRLTLEEFCVYLNSCLCLDGLGNKAPGPEAIHHLMFSMIENYLGPEGRIYISTPNVIGWTPAHARVFPNGTVIRIHISAIAQIGSHFIYEIGHKLLKIPKSKTISKYFQWCDNWTFTHTFINRFHNEYWTFVKKNVDRETIAKDGFFLLEALTLARSKGIEYDEAVIELKNRHASYQAALSQINSAFENGYYLESVTLQECLISHCIHNFLINRTEQKSGANFHSLIRNILEFKDKKRIPKVLFEKIDSWRLKRNDSIHGYFTLSNLDFEVSSRTFKELSSNAAKEGIELVKQVLEWYQYECVDYLEHEFAVEQRKLH